MSWQGMYKGRIMRRDSLGREDLYQNTELQSFTISQHSFVMWMRAVNVMINRNLTRCVG